MNKKKLYVGNLSYQTTEAELEKLFAEIGPVVSTDIITDTNSGRSKGFGFVEMETEQAAQEAIKQLNNLEFGQRNILVSEARPPKKRPPGGGRSGGSSGGRGKPSRGGDRDRGDRHRY